MPLMGMEGAGVVEAVGEGVTHLKVGDRAAYASKPPGSYCEARVMPAKTRVQAARRHQLRDRRGHDAQGPDGAIPAQEDAAGGRPAARRPCAVPCRRRRRGPDRLPVGQGAGLQLIGTAGTDAKCQLALANGAAHAINYPPKTLPRA
jgi:NADPH2:quinone reductase